MKASELILYIRENLKDYPIEYLKNKAQDDRYPDSITKRLAIYNSSIYDEIFDKEIEDDFDIKDSLVKKIEDDVNYYFSIYDPYDDENRDFTRNLCLYLSLIAKKPLHPFGNNPNKDNMYLLNEEYFCKDRIKYLKDENSLCRYCVCKKAGLTFGFF
ncbi:DUF2115 family protein [uncultured Methanobrevibacter sp.]|uniref:DUF2115 family protein n=1 Tax=uncultured Methanobrevibacter sp. TaxID=253161 RepID=UPI0025D13C0D|nr:DUF2115 family protein [uncultured Methanobrevibacter sp.]